MSVQIIILTSACSEIAPATLIFRFHLIQYVICSSASCWRRADARRLTPVFRVKDGL